VEATLSSKNQVTILKTVREYLNLKPGDRFKFFLQPDGAVVIPEDDDLEQPRMRKAAIHRPGTQYGRSSWFGRCDSCFPPRAFRLRQAWFPAASSLAPPVAGTRISAFHR
jgi:AbrB family looped-hinge helix DNA binding protein